MKGYSTLKTYSNKLSHQPAFGVKTSLSNFRNLKKFYSDMTHQNVCRYYKFGFCKYKDNCRKMHIHEKCENRCCEIKNCPLRHPRKCSFYRDFKRCKFNEWCKYDHDDNDNDFLIKSAILKMG